LGLAQARRHLDELLQIAEPGDPAAAELRERIDLATHYGLYRPGQSFTDGMRSGGRGPVMVVVPHGGFTMGAGPREADASDAERPQHYVRFDRGFALARTEVTVGQFRRFAEATGHRSRAERRGYSTVYDERRGSLVRRSGVDWRHDYTGAPASDDLPVLHVSARDAEAYAQWLAEQTGQAYRLPSEAEFEYALRAGNQGRFPWGDADTPPPNAGNFTGARDRSPGGRDWRNAFPDYGDGYWGPAPVASFAANAFGLHDMAGNVSEWVADCWHDSYRRAPADGGAWVNPGCRTRVLRGGSWASSPAQTRSAWRLSADADTTNARLGFRVARGI
jgi:formylglycine-generating enzyme required for sulfatase activity